MIHQDEVLGLLRHNSKDKIICHDFEYRPSVLASDIKTLANATDDCGFIVVGASMLAGTYIINGASRDMAMQDVVNKAVEQLTVKPQTEVGFMGINGKTVYVIKVQGLSEGTALLSERLDDTSITVFINRLHKICISLQANAKYITATEDERNDYIRDMLGQYDYVIKDQTRRGLSSSKKSSGEVDIFVEKDKAPFTVIEALNLRSMNKEYLSEHLNKIYTYDTAGNLFNVCLIYAEVKDFSSFFEKYCMFIKDYTFPYPTISIDESVDDNYNGSDIKIITTTHNRSGHPTKLFHICVKIMVK